MNAVADAAESIEATGLQHDVYEARPVKRSDFVLVGTRR